MVIGSFLDVLDTWQVFEMGILCPECSFVHLRNLAVINHPSRATCPSADNFICALTASPKISSHRDVTSVRKYAPGKVVSKTFRQIERW